MQKTVRGTEMRTVIYIFVIINVILGFVLIYRKPRPFREKTYKDRLETIDHEDEGKYRG